MIIEVSFFINKHHFFYKLEILSSTIEGVIINTGKESGDQS